MKIKILASGSKGNLYTVSDGKTKMLIEMGLPIKKIKKLLNYDLKSIDFALCSHCHGDHSKAIKDIMRVGIDCYMGFETYYYLKLLGHRAHIVKPSITIELGTFKILPFETQHDCPGSLGFLIQSMVTGEKLLFATDTYYIRYKFVGVTHFMIEASYSKAILDEQFEMDVVPRIYYDRLVKSHFEISNVQEFFMNQDLSKCKEIYLIHISDTVGDPKLFEDEIKKITGKPVHVWRS